MGYLSQAGLILSEVLFGILIGIFTLRVLLQLVRASFHNPLSQFFYRATNPVLMPLRRVLPPVGRLDAAGAAVTFLLCIIQVVVQTALFNRPPPALALVPGWSPPVLATLLFALATLVNLLLTLYFWLIIIRVILSFVHADPRHPMIPILMQLTDPILGPLRGSLPTLGPFDLSPLVATLGVVLAKVLLVQPLSDLALMMSLS